MENEGTKLMEEAAFLANLPEINFELIIRVLDQAVVKYRISKDYFEAGNAAESLAKVYEDMDNSYQAANNYKIAGEMYVNAENHLDFAKASFNKSSDLFLVGGKFVRAAVVNVLLAEISIEEGLKLNAINYYEKAYDYYTEEKSVNTGCTYLLKAASLLIDCDKYKEANKHLKSLYNHYSKNSLTKFRCTKLLLDIGIIELYLKDITECKNWVLLCSEYKDARQHKTLSLCLDFYVSHDVDKFTDALGGYQSIIPLDANITKLIQSILEDMKK